MFGTLVTLGSGLLGASVLSSVKARGLARRALTWDIRPENSAFCVERGWADAAPGTAEEAVREADLVVIATPADTVGELAQRIAPHLRRGALVTDVGSTKGHAARLAHAAMPAHAFYVGAHPMAGSEKNGPGAANADLFEGRACFVTRLPGRTDPAAAERIGAFWAALGARVVESDPDEHDEIVAHVSHLPHAAAVALACVMAARPEAWRDCAGGGLRDTTRVAGGDVAIWRAILMENRHEVTRAVGDFERELAALREALESRDDRALAEILERGKVWRDGLRA